MEAQDTHACRHAFDECNVYVAMNSDSRGNMIVVRQKQIQVFGIQLWNFRWSTLVTMRLMNAISTPRWIHSKISQRVATQDVTWLYSGKMIVSILYFQWCQGNDESGIWKSTVQAKARHACRHAFDECNIYAVMDTQQSQSSSWNVCSFWRRSKDW